MTSPRRPQGDPACRAPGRTPVRARVAHEQDKAWVTDSPRGLSPGCDIGLENCRRTALVSLAMKKTAGSASRRTDGRTTSVAGGDRDKALDAALANIERQFGKGSVMR